MRLAITDEPQEECPFQEIEKSLVYTMRMKKIDILNGLPAAWRSMQSVYRLREHESLRTK